MAIYSMFSVPIIHYEIDNWQQKKKRILDVLPPDCPEHRDSANEGLYTDFFLAEEQGHTELPDYSSTVIDIIKPYLIDFYDGKMQSQSQGNDHKESIEFTDMWYQKYDKTIQHTLHNHGSKGWSSVIYVEFDHNVHQGTDFVAPFFDTWTGDMQFYTPNVREGDMILFPSYIMHQALPNKSEKRRTVISYNLRGYIEGVKATL